VEQVPIDDFELPLGRAEILTPGSDLTLLTWGTPVYHCETALHMLSSPSPSLEAHVPPSFRTAKIEVIDLRSVLPWDVETVTESVNRTGRLVIVHEAGVTAGVGAEISAEVLKRCFLKLEAPVRRVTGWEYVQISKFPCGVPDHLLQYACGVAIREILYTGCPPHP
jgi:2-oxoisovalerate dehydrogenase E1 component beta subunit